MPNLVTASRQPGPQAVQDANGARVHDRPDILPTRPNCQIVPAVAIVVTAFPSLEAKDRLPIPALHIARRQDPDELAALPNEGQVAEQVRDPKGSSQRLPLGSLYRLIHARRQSRALG